MSFPQKDPHYTQFSKSPIAYRQFAPDDPVKESLYDVNMECDQGLRDQNRVILVIDSNDRKRNLMNPNKDSEPNNYTIKLNRSYKDVVSVELKNANIPNSDYIINEYNNIFYFQDSQDQIDAGTYHCIKMPLGNYPVDDNVLDSIRSLLEQALNLVEVGNVYQVDADPNNQLFTITQTSGSGIFNILFKVKKCSGNESSGEAELPNHIGTILGFKAFDHVGETTYTGEYVYNLHSSRYIVIRIRGMERVDSNHHAVQDSFCILQLDQTMNNFMRANNCDDLDNEVYQKDFNPPLGELDRFQIEILNDQGNPFNFRGRDHTLTFEIVSLSRHSNYNRRAKN